MKSQKLFSSVKYGEIALYGYYIKLVVNSTDNNHICLKADLSLYSLFRPFCPSVPVKCSTCTLKLSKRVH